MLTCHDAMAMQASRSPAGARAEAGGRRRATPLWKLVSLQPGRIRLRHFKQSWRSRVALQHLLLPLVPKLNGFGVKRGQRLMFPCIFAVVLVTSNEWHRGRPQVGERRRVAPLCCPRLPPRPHVHEYRDRHPPHSRSLPLISLAFPALSLALGLLHHRGHGR